MPTWRLRDTDPIALESPYTFYKPSREVIARVQVGEIVKLIFDFDSDDAEAPAAERMWVIVERIDANGDFSGRLDNEPYWISDLKAGDPIVFSARHIINTQQDDDDNLVEKYIQRCFVTNCVLNESRLVGYLYREEPERENDSGWRIMAGDETDEYMDDSSNIAYVSLGAVLNKDDSFLDLLEAPPGSAFERDPDSGKYRTASAG
jgi:hypothetical protein